MHENNYHTQTAHDARLSRRRACPVVPAPLHVYYHAALLPGWRAIVDEQFRTFAFVGLPKLYCGCVGSREDISDMQALAAKRGIAATPVSLGEFFDEYEMPTIRPLWRHACREPAAAFLYTHAKGASAPADECKKQWRRIMMARVVANWRENLELLADYDMVGTNWQHSPHFPHYQGDFWMARGDWLANLPDPRHYRDENLSASFAGQDFRRMFAEAFIGCRPWHHIKSLFCENDQWWQSKEQSDYADRDIPGFNY